MFILCDRPRETTCLTGQRAQYLQGDGELPPDPQTQKIPRRGPELLGRGRPLSPRLCSSYMLYRYLHTTALHRERENDPLARYVQPALAASPSLTFRSGLFSSTILTRCSGPTLTCRQILVTNFIDYKYYLRIILVYIETTVHACNFPNYAANKSSTSHSNEPDCTPSTDPITSSPPRDITWRTRRLPAYVGRSRSAVPWPDCLNRGCSSSASRAIYSKAGIPRDDGSAAGQSSQVSRDQVLAAITFGNYRQIGSH